MRIGTRIMPRRATARVSRFRARKNVNMHAIFHASATPASDRFASLYGSVEGTHAAAEETGAPPPEVSTYYLAVQIRSQYEGMLIALLPNEWSHWSDATPDVIACNLLELARGVDPAQVRTRRRGPKNRKPAPYVEGAVARAHHSTARLLKRAKGGTS